MRAFFQRTVWPQFFHSFVKDLLICSIINKRRNVVSNRDMLWKFKYPQNIRDDFSSLVDMKLLTWKEVNLYAPLSHLLAENIVDLGECLKVDNPQLSEMDGSHFCGIDLTELEIPSPIANHGDYRFSIYSLVDIKIVEKGQSSPSFVYGDKEKMLVYLAAENDYLFALRRDARIVQWNYKTGEMVKIIETMETENSGFIRLGVDKHLRCDRFYFTRCLAVKDGIIAIKYHNQNKGDALEIITYQQPKQRKFIKDKDLSFCASGLFIKNKRIFVYGRDQLYAYNLATNKKEYFTHMHIHPELFMTAITYDGEVVYAVDCGELTVNSKAEIHVIDLKTKLEWEFPFMASSGSHKSVRNMRVIGNFLFCQLSNGFGNHNKISVLNMTNQDAKILTFDPSVSTYPSDIIFELVKIVKPNLVPSTNFAEKSKHDQSSSNLYKCMIL